MLGLALCSWNSETFLLNLFKCWLYSKFLSLYAKLPLGVDVFDTNYGTFKYRTLKWKCRHSLNNSSPILQRELGKCICLVWLGSAASCIWNRTTLVCWNDWAMYRAQPLCVLLGLQNVKHHKNAKLLYLLPDPAALEISDRCIETTDLSCGRWLPIQYCAREVSFTLHGNSACYA